MADRPIIFSAPMVRALLEGRKTQTRRVLKHPMKIDIGIAPSVETDHPVWIGFNHPKGGPLTCVKWPYRPGDRLYVREAHSLHDAFGQDRDDGMRWGPWPGLASSINPERTRIAYYREGFDRSGPPRWRPSIHMPRWASRLTLLVTDVRVQRLQEISEEDAKSEGAPAIGAELCPPDLEDTRSYIWGFHNLWNSIHGPGAWAANPWVAAITFDVKHGNIDTPSNPDEVA